MKPVLSSWSTWQKFRAAQKEIVLPAGQVAHIPVTIRYIDVGEAQQGTILLLHGIPTWGYLYHAVIPSLVEAGYRILAPDLLGHGWSDRRDRFDRSFQDQARMITALLSTLALERVDVVGHDTGGAVALILAIEHQNYVNGEISAQTMILWGMDDPWQSAKDGKQLAQEIPGAIFRGIEGASHWVQQDAPEEFSTAILEFFATA
jgi:pimeloyl-ACP methyl ester carboxylesterase